MKILNKERIIEIDLLKGFTLILLIICHVGLYLGNPNDNSLYVFSDIIGSEPCAPIFMSLMGISILYSRHNDPSSLFKRGIKLFIFGYILSFIRTIIPLLIFGNIDEWTTIESFFVVDILQFSGLSFMLISLFRKLKLPSYVILIISLIMVYISQDFSISISNEYLIYFINLFFPVTSWSCFPLFIWFFFPVFGLCFGEILIKCKNKRKLYSIILPISLCFVIYIYYQFYKLYPNYISYYYGNNFYYMGVKNVLICSFFIMFALSIWYFLNDLLPKFITKYLEFLGRNITVFYVFSWIYISMILHINAYFNIVYDRLSTLLMMLIILVLCSISTKLYVYFKTK